MNTTIYCPDIECESCVKVITRLLDEKKGVGNFEFLQGAINITHDEVCAPKEEIARLIEQKGFRAGFEPFSRKTFTERWRDFRQNKEKYELEYEMLSNSSYTFGLLLLIESVVIGGGLMGPPSAILSRYGWMLFYLTFSVVAIGAAMWHFQSYRGNVTSMTGMMIGMTFGMQTGFLIGTVIGATNGMFVGGVVGMLSGVLVGWYNGKCCGIMGVLEGIMAGIMSGLMGAMTGVMLLVDHIYLFMPVFVILNLMVLLGLSYLLFEEMVEGNATISKHPIEFSTFFFLSFLAVAFLVTIILVAPKSGITGLV